jgi:hypothetical protein
MTMTGKNHFLVVALAAVLLIGASVSTARAESQAKVENVWVVFKTHFDLGYTDRVENVLKRYRGEMMENALKAIEADRQLPPEKQFAWTVAGWPMKHILGPEQEPARREKILQALREGTLAVHALPGSLHTESFDLEDLVRGLGFASKIARENQRPLPIAAKMTDVPEHCWVMPTLLARAGVKFLQIGCNDGCQYPRFPSLFWWEGPDGSRILCNYTPRYGSSFSPPGDWPSKNYLAMIMTGDNAGPPTVEAVEQFRKQIVETLPGVQVHFGTLDDFAKAVETERPELPVVRGDTPDSWIHGLLSMPIETKIARNVRPLEPALDSLDTQLRGWGLNASPLAGPLAEAYENSFLYGEHTWGMNGSYGGNRLWGDAWNNELPVEAQRNFLSSFDDHRNYIRKTDEIVRRELLARLSLLARSVNTEGRRIVVYNPLTWPRSGMVSIADDGDSIPIDPETGSAIPFDRDGKRLIVYADNVPASGYKTYSLAKATSTALERDEKAADNRIETPFYEVVFDLERGGISSLIEKKSGRELADKSSLYALGQFLHERFSEKEVQEFFTAYSRSAEGWIVGDIGKPGMPDAEHSPYAAKTPSAWRMSVRRSPAEDAVTLAAGDAKGLAEEISLEFTFPREAAWVEVEWRVKNKTPDKIPEGGWLCFPFAVEKPRFTLGRPGGPIDPAKDIMPGSNRHLAAVASGAAMVDASGSGAAVCPIDSPLISLDRPGLWKFSMDFTPTKPVAFVNLYNNMWNTNFPLWIEGSWSSRVRFWPIEAGKQSIAENLAVQSWEARLPLLAAVADGPSGALPNVRSGLRLSRSGVLLTAFGTNPDGDAGTLLRIWDQSGASGRLDIELPPGFLAAKARPVDLRGEKIGEPIDIASGKFSIDLEAFAPASFILE